MLVLALPLHMSGVTAGITRVWNKGYETRLRTLYCFTMLWLSLVRRDHSIVRLNVLFPGVMILRGTSLKPWWFFNGCKE